MEKKIIFLFFLVVIVSWNSYLSWYLLFPLIVYWWLYIKNTRFIYFFVPLIPVLGLVNQGQVADKIAFIVLLELAMELIRSYSNNRW